MRQTSVRSAYTYAFCHIYVSGCLTPTWEVGQHLWSGPPAVPRYQTNYNMSTREWLMHSSVNICRMPPARVAVYAALVTTAVVVCAIALTTWGIAGEQSNRVEELNTMLKRRSSGFPARAPKIRRAKQDFHPNFTPPKEQPQVRT
jgi:hypothetical protein